VLSVRLGPTMVSKETWIFMVELHFLVLLGDTFRAVKDFFVCVCPPVCLLVVCFTVQFQQLLVWRQELMIN